MLPVTLGSAVGHTIRVERVAFVHCPGADEKVPLAAFPAPSPWADQRVAASRGRGRVGRGNKRYRVSGGGAGRGGGQVRRGTSGSDWGRCPDFVMQPGARIFRRKIRDRYRGERGASLDPGCFHRWVKSRDPDLGLRCLHPRSSSNWTLNRYAFFKGGEHVGSNPIYTKLKPDRYFVFAICEENTLVYILNTYNKIWNIGI